MVGLITPATFGVLAFCAPILAYHKISKISPWANIFQKALFERLFFGEAYIRRGLSTEGNLRCKIDWASLIVRSKCTIFALFYCVFEGNFPSKSLQGTYFEGRFNGGFFAFVGGGGGGIFREAPKWRGLFSEFYGNIKL